MLFSPACPGPPHLPSPWPSPVMLGAMLAKEGHTTILVDADPQQRCADGARNQFQCWLLIWLVPTAAPASSPVQRDLLLC